MELAQKYTKSLVLGFVAGLVLSLGFWRVYPFIQAHWLSPVDRIGMVGAFTPTTLPLSIQKRISLGLTDINPDGSVKPALATSWVATDSGKIFTFFLRTDAMWHNGKPVEAKDVNYNIKNVTFTVLDPKTIRVTLNSSYSPFPTLVSRPLFQPGLVGFGEYKVSSIQLIGDTVEYIKLIPSHANSKNRAREYRFYKTETEAITAYKVGDINELDDLSSSYDLQSWGQTEVNESTKYGRIVSLFFNLNDPILRDKSVRQGLSFALPQIPGEHAYSPISKTSWAYTDKVKRYPPDATQAAKLLDIIKISSSSASLVIATFIQYVDLAQDIANSWTAAGVPTTVRVVSDIPSGYQILLSAQDVPPDPDQYPFWHSTQTQTNVTGYANVKIDKLLEDGRQEIDTEKRKTIYADFQRRLVDDDPATFLYYAKSYTINRK
ncbi:hypothetical protein A2Z00_02050 [Candidatus Gottesmanbacteria bacterium RBG_13_45_10]|uniref:Solute-binding protein family 5 domain-containing protein n=1 Tax=Candidatus Gottesmanbacteria bacterium RBG_13_45_10 TaxID=1798370 RepID=A0A1F5ZHJ7_9BACT|nr:MAG: hypothetical protein A2Z00_02050 [Candidatus Gottesmanbacteria bacterium RBG_13_45_10]